VVERNYRGRAGEIDLIAEHGADLVFIEVKTRTSADFQRPIEAVTSAKQRRIIGTAQAYLRERVGRERRYRFDVVEVMMSPQGRIESIEITAGAFSAGG
jgi:putative endonuclease